MSTGNLSIANASDDEKGSSIAIGNSANASNNMAIALGKNAKADKTMAIALGYSANASGNYSEALGIESVASGDFSLAVGRQANATGASSTAIGVGAQATGTGSTAIGNGAQATTANTIVLGTASDIVYIPGKLVVGGDSYLSINDGKTSYIKAYQRGTTDASYRGLVSLRTADQTGNISEGDILEIADVYSFDNNASNTLNTILSDRRMKNVGKAFVSGLDAIKKLEVFNYTYKKDKSKTPHVGVMAQDLQKIFPNAVTKGEDGFLRIRMEEMFYALVNAVKELDEKIEKLQNQEVATLKNRVAQLEKENKAFEKRLAELEKKIKSR